MLKFEKTTSPEGPVIVLQGRMDTASAQSCSNQLAETTIEAGQKLTIDCYEMDYISSAGIRFLLLLRKNIIAQGGTIALIGVNGEVSQVFDMTGLGDMFEM